MHSKPYHIELIHDNSTWKKNLNVIKILKVLSKLIFFFVQSCYFYLVIFVAIVVVVFMFVVLNEGLF